MPETDILNPTVGVDLTLGDSMNPSYMFDRARQNTRLGIKAVGGPPWTRETQNLGHVFTISWIGRTEACVQRIKWYSEQYEDGFFTIIDRDAGGRHYVGRFTSPIKITETANNKFDIQGATFEEMPGVPMVSYPSDWDHDSVLRACANDFGDQKVATSGTWSSVNLTAAPAITLGGISRGAATAYPLSIATLLNAGTAGEWAQYEYRGYGCKLWLRKGPTFGKADVYLDGVLVSTVDCYASSDQGAQVILTQQSVSLDIHRVKLICDGTKNSLATDTKIAWYGLQVMR